MGTLRNILTIAILSTGLFACNKIESLSDIPRIEFTSFVVVDTTDILGNTYKGGRLNFYFEDGDGDIGLKNPGINYVDTVDLFFTLYRKTDGEFTLVPDGDLMRPSDYTIPFIDPQGQNKIVKGTITVTFLYQYYSPADSAVLKYEFYMKDRALNISNTEITCEIPISRNGIYK
jgi:hypothetical protein